MNYDLTWYVHKKSDRTSRLDNLSAIASSPIKKLAIEQSFRSGTIISCPQGVGSDRISRGNHRPYKIL
ncbi:MAG TPA: hypothetical protein V6C90_00320 [Coleofasciculaceae cyanobacterium]